MEKNFDVLIIGCGPAGMTSAIYAQRAGLRSVIFEKESIGGQASQTPHIENYPGFSSISGMQLSQNMFEQAQSQGAEVVFGAVENVELSGQYKKVQVGGVTYTAPAIILSMGAHSRPLGVDGDRNYIGKGVSYCAVCDGAFFRGKTVTVVGGGNTALQDVIYLSNIADKIIHIHRRGEFRAHQTTVDQYEKLVRESGKVVPYLGFVIDSLEGDGRLSGMKVRNLASGKTEVLSTDALFVAIGRVPQTEILGKELALDDSGYILVNGDMSTNLDGVFAAGDITHKELRQVATAVGDGATAGTSASIYVKKAR